MSSRCDNNFIQTFSDRISSFQLQLQDGSTKDQQTWKDLLIQFRNNQLEFYQQLTRMVDYDVETISQIHGPLGEILAKTKEIETAFRTSQTAPSAVKALRSIASAFRAGDEESAMRDFGRNIPDGNGSIAGTVFGCMWDLLAASRVAPFHEFGRGAFFW